MVELQSGLGNIANAGATLWAVNFDKPDTLKKVKKALKITYPLLSDAGSKTIDAYGIRNKSKNGTVQEGIASPTIFIINQDGIISSSYAFESIGHRHGSKDIIKALK